MPQKIKILSFKRYCLKTAVISTPIILILSLALIATSYSMPTGVMHRFHVHSLREPKPGVYRPLEAKPLSDVIDKYLKSSLCCESFNEFQYKKLRLPDGRKFNISGDSGAFDFETGKSYFASFELPDYKRPYRITIRSFIVGKIKKGGYILSPALIFLDKDFQITRYIGTESIKLSRDAISSALGIGPRYEAIIGMTRENINERYIIIMTSAALLDIKEKEAAPDSSGKAEEGEESTAGSTITTEKDNAAGSTITAEKDNAAGSPVTAEKEGAYDIPVMKEIKDAHEIPVVKEEESTIDTLPIKMEEKATATPSIKKKKNAAVTPTMKDKRRIKKKRTTSKAPSTNSWKRVAIPNSPVGRLRIDLTRDGD